MGARTWRWVCSLGLGVFAFACGDDGGGGSNASDVGPGRGTDACQDWQDAVCQKAKECDADEAQCLQNYRAFECISDVKAKQCTLAWQNQAACQAPADCDFAEVADPAPAQQRCQEFKEVLCAASARCENTVEADCLANAEIELPCDFALGTGLGYEECITTLKGTCVTELPKICEGVVLSSQ